jgi:hypothetical protein
MILQALFGYVSGQETIVSHISEHVTREGSAGGRVINFLKRILMEMHNSFEKQDSIHRDVIYPGLSLDASRIWRILCFVIATKSSHAFITKRAGPRAIHGCDRG